MSARAIVGCLVVLTASLAGCAPGLRGDGHYGCARGACPEVAPHCWADLLCHVTPEGEDAGALDASSDDASATDASTDDASAIDTGVPIDARAPIDARMPSRYLACNPGTCMPLDRCIGGGADGTGPGYCAPPCATTACPGMASDWICSEDDSCLVTCESSADCPSGMPCLSGTFARVRASVCMDEALARPPELYAACASSAECPEPLTCVNGACLRECGGGGLCDAGASEVCLPLPPPMDATRVCVVSCPGPCPTGTACRMAGPATMRCTPDAWPPPG